MTSTAAPKAIETRFRSKAVRERPQGVDREARAIRGFAVIQAGVEALGHGLWIDDDFAAGVLELGGVRRGGNDLEGVRSRFRHPDMCNDGMGSHLGRVRNFRQDGDVIRADLLLAKVASKAPDGDLAGYVMDLAEEDAGAFGASIAFRRDHDAERAFLLEHGAKEDPDAWDRALDTSGFKSPDKRNTANLPHARIAALKAVDVVDSPAATRGGLFSGDGSATAQASNALAYALGLSDDAPTDLFGVEPVRLRHFFQTFIAARGLRLSAEEPPMATATSTPTPAPAAPASPLPDPLARLTAMRADPAFAGRDAFVLDCFAAGDSVTEAKAKLADVLLGEAAERETRITDLGDQVEALKALGAGAHKGAGFSAGGAQTLPQIAPKTAPSGVASFEDACKQEWESNADVRAEFAEFEDFQAYRRREARKG